MNKLKKIVGLMSLTATIANVLVSTQTAYAVSSKECPSGTYRCGTTLFGRPRQCCPEDKDCCAGKFLCVLFPIPLCSFTKSTCYTPEYGVTCQDQAN